MSDSSGSPIEKEGDPFQPTSPSVAPSSTVFSWSSWKSFGKSAQVFWPFRSRAAPDDVERQAVHEEDDGSIFKVGGAEGTKVRTRKSVDPHL